MDHFLLVDGHNLLFRMFYGMPDHFRTPSGVRYNAVYGVGNALAGVIADLGPTHALVLFDTEECGERRKLDAEYKANRPDYSEMDEDELPFSQIPAICSLLDACGIPHAEARGCEADDLIASYALRTQDADCRVLIFSTDRDYWQLISPRVSVVDYRSGVCSLLGGEAVDSLIFFPIVFAGIMPIMGILTIVLTQVICKTLYELVALPLTALVVRIIKKKETDVQYE